MKLPLDCIQITGPTRRDLLDIEGLALSMSTRNQQFPIVVTKGGEDGKFILVDGERRLRAAERLEWAHIEAIYIDDVDPFKKEQLGLEVSLRKDKLSWQDYARTMSELFYKSQQQHGIARPGRAGIGWSLRDQAISLGLSVTKVHQELNLAKGLRDYPELLEFPSRRAAIEYLNKMKELSRGEFSPEQISELIDKFYVVGNFRDYLLPSNKFDIVIYDPPEQADQLNDFNKLKDVMHEVCEGYYFFRFENFNSVIENIQAGGFIHDPMPYMITYLEGGHTQSFLWFGRGINRPPVDLPHLINVTKDHYISEKDKPYSLLMKLLYSSTYRAYENVLEPYSYGGIIARVAIHLNKGCTALCCRPSIYQSAKSKIKEWSVPYGEKNWYS